MRIDVVKPYVPELVFGAVGVGALAGCIATGGIDGASLAAPSLLCTGVGVVALGGLAGSCVRRAADAPARAEQATALAELGERPTKEEHAALEARVGELEGQLADAQRAVEGLGEELAKAQQEQERLGEELSAARMTASLDRFSNFQLLAMCDVCDAEDDAGYLARPLSDPAMEQLQALGVVTFAVAQDGEKDLRWTLAPEWRQAVRAHRADLEARVGALRTRRVAEEPAD